MRPAQKPLAAAALVIAVAIAGIAIAFAPPRTATAGPDDEKLAKALENAILDHFEALTDEKLDKAMTIMHPQMPSLAATRRALEQQIATYDLKFKLVKFSYFGNDGEYATVRVQQETAKIAGPVFQDNIVDMVHVFRKDGNTWKLWQSALLDMKKLGQPR